MLARALIIGLAAVVLWLGVAKPMATPMEPMISMTSMASMASVVPSATRNIAHSAKVDRLEAATACADGTGHCPKRCNRLDSATFVFTRAPGAGAKFSIRKTASPAFTLDLAPEVPSDIQAPGDYGAVEFAAGGCYAGTPFKTVFARTSRFLS